MDQKIEIKEEAVWREGHFENFEPESAVARVKVETIPELTEPGPSQTMHEKCQICGMYTDSEEGQQQGIFFHHFPVARPNICREWLDVVGVERLRQLPPKQLRNRTVCSRHFRHSSYPGPLSKMLSQKE
ncbi:uncharacterized protein [Anabrus simplex]|uniref:uncharacterized protein isoform X3 n=1 Tax=Anabrus simplex TaxID=316456 RepID=UPI0035A3348B